VKNALRLSLALGALSLSAGCDCEHERAAYYAAVEAATQCNPAATEPCAAYDRVCGPVGVNPDSIADLSGHLSGLKATGCTLDPVGHPHSCLVGMATKPPYTCQAKGDGGFRCYSVCEQVGFTCVGQSAGCAGLLIPQGFCSGESMVCCYQ
jgi:hypothetical protein